LNILQ